jgi:hypothetical protein
MIILVLIILDIVSDAVSVPGWTYLTLSLVAFVTWVFLASVE